MKNDEIILIIILIILITIALLVLRRKNEKENFQAPSTCSATITTVEPEWIIVASKQPPMFRAYEDRALAAAQNITFLPSNPSICNWFQAGNIVNVNYNTTVVCKGSASNIVGLMYFYLYVTFDKLPAFNTNTNVTGSGVYTMIGYGTQSLLNKDNDNYKLLNNGTVMVKKIPTVPLSNKVELSCVQHYNGPANFDQNWYTYDVSIQFSYNI